MSYTTCSEITEWIEEEVSKPVEEWEERQKRKCKDYPWYDPRGWACWFVTYFVKVIRWVIVKVGKWVSRTVCTVVGIVIDIVVAVIGGLADVIVGIFTLDWRRILDGLLGIGLGLVAGFFRLLRILLLGDLIDYIREEIDRGRLRDHVRTLLEAKYAGDTLQQIGDAIRLDHGAFGLRLQPTAYRTVLDSETPSEQEPAVPNLVVLHEAGAINLRALCGFDYDEGFWNRKRYKTLKKGTVGGGTGELTNPISSDELDTYLSSRGARGPRFTVLPMSDGVLSTKISTAEGKGRELGLMFDFDDTTPDLPITRADHVIQKGYDTPVAESALDTFLIDVVHRVDKSVDPGGAVGDLCHPVTVGVFRYTDTLRGLTATLESTRCGLSGGRTSGLTFIDNKPDEIWKYVVMHELGHYFGLCHVDGLDRIMYSAKKNSWWTWRTLGNLLYLQGEPTFVLDEAKAAWNYIVANFSPECIGAKTAPVPVGIAQDGPLTRRSGARDVEPVTL